MLFITQRAERFHHQAMLLKTSFKQEIIWLQLKPIIHLGKSATLLPTQALLTR